MYRIRDWLYIGSYRDRITPGLLTQHGITAMLELADHVEHNNINTLQLPVADGVIQTDDDLRRGIAFIREQRAAGHVVLSACAAGISRSTTYALGALKEEENIPSILTALAEIKAHHPNALPHIRLWHSLNRYYGEDIPYTAIWSLK
jgi:predicted protein tyrosine phosphatase